MAEIFAAAAIAAALVCVFVCARTLRRVKRQLREMADALEDVRNGNGGRRILSGTRELTAPLAYAMNEIVQSYESQLSAYRRTEEANRQLMTSLSHDVRTPLTTLIGYLDAAQRGIVSGQERENYIETARRKAYDLKAYIDVLFDWFRLGSDEYSLQIAAVDLTELTRGVLIDWAPVLEEARIELDAEIPERPFRAQADPEAYRRIVNNLIQNAVAHSHARRLSVSLSEQDGRVRLRLADDGDGIRREDLKHIFDRLYKCDGSRSEKGGGLGLSIARQLAEKMRGSLSAESEPGRGTAFTLLLPSIE